MFTVALLILFSVLCILLSGDGAWDNVTKPSRNALVFEGRPKDYGAFTLRREYDRRFILAFCGALTFVSMAVIVPKVMALMVEIPTGVTVVPYDDEHEIVDVTFPPPPDPKTTKATTTTTAAVTNPTPAAIPVIVDSIIKPIERDSMATQPNPDSLAFAAKGPIGEPGDKKPVETGGGGGKTGTSPEPPRGETLQFVPQFPGGEMAMFKFIKDNIRYPDDAFERGISEKIHVEFVIEPDGSIGTVNIVKGNFPSLRNEAARVVRAMPRWSPGRMNDHAVRCRLVLPVNFTVSQ
jgi:periplasmic protein TonB